jgi:hypothetical protein
MSLFEFLMVLVSIIIGLGIAEILTGVARQSGKSGVFAACPNGPSMGSS